MLHEHPEDPERVVGEIRLFGVCIAQADHILALHLGRVPVPHDGSEEGKVLVVVKRRAGLQIRVPRRLVIAFNERMKGSRCNDARFVLMTEYVRVFFPERGGSKLIFKLLGRPSAPLKIQPVALLVDVLWQLTFSHDACLSPRTRHPHVL